MHAITARNWPVIGLIAAQVAACSADRTPTETEPADTSLMSLGEANAPLVTSVGCDESTPITISPSYRTYAPGTNVTLTVHGKSGTDRIAVNYAPAGSVITVRDYVHTKSLGTQNGSKDPSPVGAGTADSHKYASCKQISRHWTVIVR